MGRGQLVFDRCYHNPPSNTNSCYHSPSPSSRCYYNIPAITTNKQKAVALALKEGGDNSSALVALVRYVLRYAQGPNVCPNLTLQVILLLRLQSYALFGEVVSHHLALKHRSLIYNNTRSPGTERLKKDHS